MAVFAFTDCYLTVNSVDLSNDVKSITINYEAEMLDDTAMGDTARSNLAGLLNGTMEVTFNQDYGSSQVDATLFGLVGAAAFACAVKPDNATISATNPEYQFNALLKTYTPLGGSVGDLAAATASFQLVTAITRDTSP